MFDIGGELHYIGVWRPGDDSFAIWSCPTWTQFVDTWQELNGRGLSLIDIEVEQLEGQPRYFGVFRAAITEHLLGQDQDWAHVAP